MSEEPQPLTLSEVKILFSDELSKRENRLRCVDCGHFQPVPEVEEVPEAPASNQQKIQKMKWKVQKVQLVILAVQIK